MRDIRLHARNSVKFLAAVLVFSTSSADDSTEITTTDQIMLGMTLAGGVLAAVKEYWLDKGHFPTDNSEAGVGPANQIVGRYVASVTVTNADGIVSVEFGGEAAWEIFGRTIEMTPKIESGDKFRWICSSQYIAHDHLPESCGGKPVSQDR